MSRKVQAKAYDLRAGHLTGEKKSENSPACAISGHRHLTAHGNFLISAGNSWRNIRYSISTHLLKILDSAHTLKCKTLLSRRRLAFNRAGDLTGEWKSKNSHACAISGHRHLTAHGNFLISAGNSWRNTRYSTSTHSLKISVSVTLHPRCPTLTLQKRAEWSVVPQKSQGKLALTGIRVERVL